MTVHSGNRDLGFNSPMFKATQRAHLPTTKGDAEWAIRHTGNLAAGPDHVKCLDFNLQVVILVIDGAHVAVPFGGHWTRFRMNGYTRYVRPRDGKIVRIPIHQQHWTYQQWVDHYGGGMHALKMLRRKNGDTVLTWGQAVPLAIENGVVLTPELKSIKFGQAPVAEYLVQVCRTHDYPCWAMALLKMKHCEQKCAAVINAGGQFAIIFGKFRNQARGDNKILGWKIKPTEIWGPASARQWLRS